LDINAFVDVSVKDFSGEAKIFSNSDEQSFEATLRYKKIADIFYLSGILPENFATQVPFDVNNTWLAIDKGALEQENLLTAGLEPLWGKTESLKSLNNKFNNFLSLIKERKLVSITDPHETKDWQDKKLKKISFSISPEKNEDFILAFWEAFDDKPLESLQEKLLALKNEDPKAWQSSQDLLNQLNLNLWVDTDTKEIFGLEVNFDNFAFMQGEQKIVDINFHFTQMMEEIAKPAIETPSEVIGVEELMQLLFESSGASLAEGESFDITSIFSLENLMAFQGGLEVCKQAGQNLTAPAQGVKICDVADAPLWPELPVEYQWSQTFVSSMVNENLAFEFCFYGPNTLGVTCSYSGSEQSCYAKACLENIGQSDCVDTECLETNIFDSDSDGLSDSDEISLHFTDPNNPDSDNDGLNDGLEISSFKTNPNNPDSDSDTYSDGQEVNNGYNPLGDGLLEL
ncbi:hypothetical protein KBC40_03195, partial [Patescibacteria group bacterium]|nr:hypothetical protein [Patescibacteria group bacterium]